MSSSQNDSHQWFLTTHWSIVLKARDASNSAADLALAELCQTYWRPLYAFLRRSGNSPHDAQDLTQAFFATLIDKAFLTSVDREKGRFRSFLLASIKHFVANHRAYQNAAKRGGGRLHLSFDYNDGEQWYAVSTFDNQSPEHEFEYRWALTVLHRALRMVRDEFEKSGKLNQFEHLQPFLVVGADSPNYAELAAKLGLAESGARSAVHRLRKLYRRSLREQVAQTVDNEEDIDDELRHLIKILGRN